MPIHSEATWLPVSLRVAEEGRRPRSSLIGVEATGNDRWFRKLVSELGHELLVGDASAIHASAPREQRTDKRAARHILRLLVENRFPAIWQPSVANEEQRQLLLHRCRLVRMRTRIKNQLDSIAKNEGLTGSRTWSGKRRQQIEALPLTGWYAERRADLLGLLARISHGPSVLGGAGVFFFSVSGFVQYGCDC